MVPIPCPVCGATETRSGWDFGTFAFKVCRGCGHHYQNPQPVFDDLKARYQESYFQYEVENEEAFFRLMVLGLEDIGFSGWEEPSRKAGAFLDIGCATGRLLEHMRDRGWRVQGVEICAASARYGREKRGVQIFTGPLENADFPPGTYSLIHFSHLIEHVPDPRDLLNRVSMLLSPGGSAIIVTPNRKGFQARLLGRKWRSCIADHLHLFHPAGLARLLSDVGFTIRRVQTWGGIAKGLAPDWVKAPVDRFAKVCGFGDVMLFWVSK